MLQDFLTGIPSYFLTRISLVEFCDICRISLLELHYIILQEFHYWNSVLLEYHFQNSIILLEFCYITEILLLNIFGNLCYWYTIT